MSGHASYARFISKIPKGVNIFKVPSVIATTENIKPYGEFVYDFHKTKTIKLTWPKTEGREIDKNTGNQALDVEDDFTFKYKNRQLFAHNKSVPNGEYITGVIPKEEESLTSFRSIFTREANYHCCGGQIIYPKKNIPYALLLSKAGDDIEPQNFVSFLFDGSCGFQIYPYVWHQPPYPFTDTEFKNKQCSVHSCVTVDTVDEFNTILEIQLVPFMFHKQNYFDLNLNIGSISAQQELLQSYL